MPEMQGKGYATEAALAARNYAFEVVGAETLVSYIHPDNEASKRLAERMGAIAEKTIELLDYGPHMVYRHPKGTPTFKLDRWVGRLHCHGPVASRFREPD